MQMCYCLLKIGYRFTGNTRASLEDYWCGEALEERLVGMLRISAERTLPPHALPLIKSFACIDIPQVVPLTHDLLDENQIINTAKYLNLPCFPLPGSEIDYHYQRSNNSAGCHRPTNTHYAPTGISRQEVCQWRCDQPSGNNANDHWGNGVTSNLQRVHQYKLEPHNSPTGYSNVKELDSHWNHIRVGIEKAYWWSSPYEYN